MNRGRGDSDVTLVSRLAWCDPGGFRHTVEVPHVRGIPVIAGGIGPGRASWRRAWPNRAGVLEIGGPTDTVDWYADLADTPSNGSVVMHGEPIAGGIDERTAWFRWLVKVLEQIRGVTAPIPPEAPCGIILTPGIPADRLVSAAHRFPGAIDALPERLAEFPGGIQLRVTPEAWLHADAYAVTVQEVLEEKD